MDDDWTPQSPRLSSHQHAEPEPPVDKASHSRVTPPLLHSKPPPPPPYMPRGVPKEESMRDADYLPDAALPSNADVGNGTAAPTTDHITIKNHFPVARIKRIMQADDDVGKVAQVTPVVVSKALELFMISLVTKAAAEAKSRNSKRVAAVHLKQAITKNEQFDFLNEIVSKVADAPEKNDSDAMDVDGKKKKTAGRKKRKTDDDDDY